MGGGRGYVVDMCVQGMEMFMCVKLLLFLEWMEQNHAKVDSYWSL